MPVLPMPGIHFTISKIIHMVNFLFSTIKKTSSVLYCLLSIAAYAQQSPIVLPNNASYSNKTGPQGALRYQRAFYLLTTTELSNAGLTSGMNINSIGFTIARAQSDTTKGKFKVYLQNTADNVSRADTGWTYSSSTTNSFAATGIPQGNYEWQVKSNCALNSAYSSSINFSNSFLSGCNTPYNLSTSNITASTATLNWEASSSPVFSQYQIEYSRLDIVNWISATTPNNSYNISGLLAGKSYQWRVKSLCSNSTSSTAYASFNTGTVSTCNAVTGLATSLTNDTTVALSWNTAAGATYYELQFRRAGLNAWSSAIAFSNATNLTLPVGTTYQWQIRSVCAAGATGAYTTGPDFSTGGTAVCYTPQNLITSQITSTSALFTWSAVSGATSYNIRYRLKNTISWTNATTPMTLACDSMLTIPKITGQYNVAFHGGNNFTYNGGGLYIAYEYERPTGPLSTANLTLSTSAGTTIYGANGSDSLSVLLSLVSSDDTALTAQPTILAEQKLRPETRLGSSSLQDSVEVIAVYSLGKTAVAFQAPTNVSAFITNKTNSTKTYAVSLTVKAKQNGVVRYNTTQNVAVAAGDSSLLQFNGWIPSILEDDSIIVQIPAQTGENVLNNNRKFYLQTVTTSTLAYEDGSTAVSAAGFNTGAGLLLNKYSIKGCGKVLAAQVYLTEDAKNKALYAVVRNTAGAIVAQSSSFTGDSSETNKYHAFYFTTPASFLNEDFYIGLAQAAAATGYNPVGAQWEDAVTRNGAYYRANLDGTGLQSDSSLGRLMIRADIAASTAEPFINGVTTLCSNSTATLSIGSVERRFASEVISYSSQSYSVDYSAQQALGTPNVYPANGVNPNAWASSTADGSREFLVLGFPNPSPINFIDVYETSNAGAIDTIYVKNPATLQYDVVYTNTAAATPTSSKKHVTFPLTTYNVSEIRITLNSAAVSGYNSIDAVDIGRSTLPATFSTYLWTPGGETSATKTISTAGTYKVTVTNANGCSFSDSISIAAATTTPPIITANGPLVFCEGDSVVLTSNILTGNTWSTGATSRSIVVKTPGNYSVSYNNAGGCGAVMSAITVITVNALPTPVITGKNSLCPGSTTILNVGSYNSYYWSTGTTTPTITVSTSGTFSVRVTNQNGCTANASFTTTIAAVPTPIITGTLQFCPGSSTVLDAGPGYISYAWSNNATTRTITVSTAESFSVTVTNGNGCTGNTTAATSFYTPPAPSITGNAAICPGGSVTLTADSGYNSYLWNTGASTQSITVNAANTYTVTVTNNNGCTGSISKTIINGPTPTPVISGTLSFCGGSATTLDAGAGYSSYIWNTGATSQSILVTAAATYSVTVTNTAGCTGSASATTTTQGSVPASPGIISGNTGGICNSTGNVYNISPVVNASFYNWTVPAGATITAGQGSTSITVSFANTFTSGNIVVAASNACGQSPSNTARTLMVQGASASPGNISGELNGLCGQSAKVYSIAAVYGASSYTWTVPAGSTITAGQGSRTITITFTSSFSTGNICVRANSSCGSSAYICTSVAGKPGNVGAINGPTAVCSKQKNVVYSIGTVAGATSYTWTAPSQATIVAGQGTTSITVNYGVKNGNVTVQANNGCGSSTILALPVSLSGCIASSIAKGVVAEDEKAFTTGMDVYPNPTVGPTVIDIKGEKGSYTLSVTDASGRTVYVNKVNYNGNKINADFGNLAKGIYFLKVFNSSYKKTIRLIIQ